jgi:cytochrome c-type biogenesis protein CcmH/NrfF
MSVSRMRALALLVALAFVVPAFGLASSPRGLPIVGGLMPGVAAAAPAQLLVVERDVMCVVCGVPLDEADSDQATREKVFIEQLIAKGENQAQVENALVGQYGTAVLALPPAHGFNLAVYLVPILVAIAVLILLAVLLPRWRRRAPAAAFGGGVGGGAGAAVPGLSPRESARLDEELARSD